MDNDVWCLCSDWGCFFDWLDRWQTLISGILATGAAGLTIWFLRRQIRSTEQQHEERIRLEEQAAYRRSLMARAGLPLALSRLCAYTELAFFHVSGAARPPGEPIEDLSSLRASIEYVDDAAAVEIARLLSRYQICRARLLALDHHNDNARLDCYYDHVELRHVIDGLFPYARREVPHFDGYIPTAATYLVALDECDIGSSMRTNDRNAICERIAAVFNADAYATGGGAKPIEGPYVAPAP